MTSSEYDSFITNKNSEFVENDRKQKMKIEFKLSLQRLSLLSASLAVWEQEDIKNEVINHFLKTKVRDRKSEWKVIIKRALRKISPSSLPSVLLCELLYAIKSAGIRIYDWFIYLRNIKMINQTLSRNEYEKYLKKIYWTPYGTIDEIKTLKNLWLNNANIECWKLFDFACCFCAKDVIDDLWEKYSEIFYGSHNCHLYTKYSLHILTYWTHHQSSALDSLLGKIENHAGDEDSIYETNYSIEENMLRASVKSGHHLALQYFWKALTEEQRERNAVFCFENVLESLEKFENEDDESTRQYVKDRIIEICIFLFNNVSEEAKKKVFEVVYWSDGTRKLNKNLKTFIEIFMTSYPWNDFVAPIVIELKNKNYFTFTDLEYHFIFRGLTNQMISDYDLGLPIDNSVMQRQFCVLWQMIPLNYKSGVASFTLWKFLDLWNLKLIKFILYDKDLKLNRMKLLVDSYDKCKYIYNNDYEMLGEFIDNLLIFDDWDNNIKILMKKLYRLLKDCSIKEANEELIQAVKEQKIAKSMISFDLLYFYLIKSQKLELANALLYWMFDYSESSVKNFRSKLRNNNKFSRYYIYNLWANAEIEKDFKRAEKYSTKYIHNILNLNTMDKIASYINEILTSLQASKFYELQTFFILKNKFKCLNKFLNWCSNTKNKPTGMKEEFIKQGYVDKICRRYIEENDLHSAGQLLQWAFPSSQKLLTFKLNFITSDKGTKALQYFIATADGNDLNPESRKNEIIVKFKDFINFWIKPLKEITEIIKTLNVWNRHVGQNIRNDLNVSNLDFEENESVVGGFRQYKRSSNKHLFWDTGNYALFIRLLGCSHCHFMKSLNNVNEDCDD